MSREGFKKPCSSVHSGTPHQISEEELTQVQWLCASPGAHRLRFKQPSVRTTAGRSHHTGQAVGSKMSCPARSLCPGSSGAIPASLLKRDSRIQTGLILTSANSAVHFIPWQKMYQHYFLTASPCSAGLHHSCVVLLGGFLPMGWCCLPSRAEPSEPGTVSTHTHGREQPPTTSNQCLGAHTGT